MSRPSALPSSRSLTLTEELERLEQSITLTLQEIDANFSKAHRIVTSSILPIVEQYAKSSDAVWEGSKFWKQFFEASANVSLSSYEEPAEHDDTADAETALEGETTNATTLDDTSANTTTIPIASAPPQHDDNLDDSSLLDSPSLHAPAPAPARQTTPQRRANSKQAQDSPSFADYPSPYETLKQKMTSTSSYRAIGNTRAPATPNASAAPSRIPTFNPASTPAAQSSPFLPMSAAAGGKSTNRRNADPLLHRVLDKNHRIQATPHTTTRTITAQGKGKGGAAASVPDFGFDSSPYSSPAPAAPQLRSEIFGTPIVSRARGGGVGGGGGGGGGAAAVPRTPGISIQHSRIPQRSGRRTPTTTNAMGDSTRRTLFTPVTSNNTKTNNNNNKATAYHTDYNYDPDLDSDTEADDPTLSPPKTIQFHIPQTQQRLMQTPAREASRRIVEDLLEGVGLGLGESTLEIERLNVRGLDSSDEGEEQGEEEEDLEGQGYRREEDGGFGVGFREEEEENSPSVIRVRAIGEGGGGGDDDDDAF